MSKAVSWTEAMKRRFPQCAISTDEESALACFLRKLTGEHTEPVGGEISRFFPVKVRLTWGGNMTECSPDALAKPADQ